MTTPTTARELAKLLEKMGDLHAQMALLNLADQVDALKKQRDELRLQIDIQAGSIEAVQSANQRLAGERDALAANHKECVRCLGEALQDTTNLAVDRDALAAAAKLALDALNLFKSSVDMYHKNGPDWTHKDGTEVFEVGVLTDHQEALDDAIAALKQAGVQ